MRPVKALLSKCFVVHHSVAKAKPGWLAASPYHFFVQYQMFSMVPDWKEKVFLKVKEVPACKPCFMSTKKGLYQGKISMFDTAIRIQFLNANK